MSKLTLKLLPHTQHGELEEYLRLYQRSFNPDERVSPSVLRRVTVPSPARVNPVHLFAAYLGDRLIGGACTLVLPAFSAVLGSYLFVDPELRGHGLGMRILRQVLQQQRRGAPGVELAPLCRSYGRFRPPMARRTGSSRFPIFPRPVAAHLLSPSGQSRCRQARLFPVPEKSSAPILPTCTADVYPCLVLWSGFDASVLTAAPEELRTLGRLVPSSGYRIGRSQPFVMGE